MDECCKNCTCFHKLKARRRVLVDTSTKGFINIGTNNIEVQSSNSRYDDSYCCDLFLKLDDCDDDVIYEVTPEDRCECFNPKNKLKTIDMPNLRMMKTFVKNEETPYCGYCEHELNSFDVDFVLQNNTCPYCQAIMWKVKYEEDE